MRSSACLRFAVVDRTGIPTRQPGNRAIAQTPPSLLRTPAGWRRKSEYDKLSLLMAVKSCRVTVTDLEGVSHTAQVTATTLYEAVALGLAAVRGHEWVAGIPRGVATVRVSVTSLPVEHAVKVRDFTRWLERKSGSPREVADRERIRAILGLPRGSP